jgi:isocitrate lyase
MSKLIHKISFSIFFLLGTSLFGMNEDDAFHQEVQKISAWWSEDRHKDIQRPYTAEKVAALRETLTQDYPSNAMAKKAWNLFSQLHKNHQFSHTFGALDPVQVVEMAEHLTSVYVSGWQCSSTASTSHEPGPDFADYPMDTVPNKVQQLFEAQRFHDRKQKLERSQMSLNEKASNPAIDFLRPIIADADTGHGGLTAVMKLTKMFIQRGAAGIHFEDQKPGTKKCGHMSGKVLVSTQEHCDRLIASRLQADIMGSDLLIVARTDAESANLLDTNIDPRDHVFILGSTNPHLMPLADVIRLATEKFERKQNPSLYQNKLKKLSKFPTLVKSIQALWKIQDGIDKTCAQKLSTKDLEKQCEEALNQLSLAWHEEADLKTYYTAVRDALVQSSKKDKEALLLAWKNKHDPMGGTSNEGEPLNALSHAEEVILAKDLGVEIFWDWDAPRTFEGYYQIKGGVAMSIARGRAFAPYADMLWMETASPNLDEAALFAQGISRLYPKKFLAYNLSPSFNWDKFGMTDPEIASYQDKLGNLGYVWQFITLAGFHGDALFAKTFAKDFAERKMLAYVQGVQRKEREQKVSALTHQKWSGVELIGSQQNAATDNRNSTGAHGSKSTEHQFSKNTAHK